MLLPLRADQASGWTSLGQLKHGHRTKSTVDKLGVLIASAGALGDRTEPQPSEKRGGTRYFPYCLPPPSLTPNPLPKPWGFSPSFLPNPTAPQPLMHTHSHTTPHMERGVIDRGRGWGGCLVCAHWAFLQAGCLTRQVENFQPLTGVF